MNDKNYGDSLNPPIFPYHVLGELVEEDDQVNKDEEERKNDQKNVRNK